MVPESVFSSSLLALMFGETHHLPQVAHRLGVTGQRDASGCREGLVSGQTSPCFPMKIPGGASVVRKAVEWEWHPQMGGEPTLQPTFPPAQLRV